MWQSAQWKALNNLCTNITEVKLYVIIIIIINLFLLSATSDPSGSALSAVQ